ncbi:MAG: SH3 domain-containing protein [candidate division Zixibacteria bacterium]|nr:SH3 domain-containing protein [candidate division Zixibacteria bacterium]MCI0596708.1 SH3 domain-containing protein [candidate division Zixibacteria bacterium]
MKKFLFFSPLLFILLFSAALAQAQVSVRIRVQQANARQAPNSNAEILAVLVKDAVYPLSGDVPYWYEITLPDGRRAFVAKSLCTVVGEASEDEEEISQPADVSYAVPSFGPAVSLPDCTPSELTVDWSICPPEGSASQTAYRLTNRKKNRIEIPCAYSTVGVEEVLALKNLPKNVRTLSDGDPRLTYLLGLESKPVMMEAFLAMVKKSEKETTNCDSPNRKDLHVELLAADTGDPKDQRYKVVVTEVTPWFSENHASWTAADLGQYASYKGGYGNMLRAPTRVRVYGWLFFDNAHADAHSIGNWRGTAWEVHPITRIEVWENGNWKTIE